MNTDKVTISNKGRNTISGHNNVTSKSESVKVDAIKYNSKYLDPFEESKVSDAYQGYFDNLKDLLKSKMKNDAGSGNSKSSYNPPKSSTYSEMLNEYNKQLKSYLLQQYELDRIKKNNDKAIEKEQMRIIKRDAEMLSRIVSNQTQLPSLETISKFNREIKAAGKIKSKTIRKKQIKKIIQNFVKGYGDDVNIKKYIDKRLLPSSLSKLFIGDDKKKRKLKEWEIYELAKDKANTIEYAGALGTALAIGFAPGIIGGAVGKAGGSLAASKSLPSVIKGGAILSQSKVGEIVSKGIAKKAAESIVTVGSGVSMLKITGESLKRAIDQINQQAIKKVKPGNVSTPWYTTYRKNIELLPKKMYSISKHFNKHGREMGYYSKKEYDAAARAFVERNKDTATMYEGIWNDSHGGQSNQVQIIIQAEGYQAIINKETMLLIDFYKGNSLRGFINIRNIPVK